MELQLAFVARLSWCLGLHQHEFHMCEALLHPTATAAQQCTLSEFAATGILHPARAGQCQPITTDPSPVLWQYVMLA
jgi:hypothetical protein